MRVILCFLYSPWLAGIALLEGESDVTVYTATSAQQQRNQDQQDSLNNQRLGTIWHSFGRR
jgi:hypothetical protein